MKKLRLGTRGSNLALWQANHVAKLINELAGVEVEIVIIKTKGDKILDVALSKIGDKGLFTKEIENQLLEGEIDIAVHEYEGFALGNNTRTNNRAVLEEKIPRIY